MPLWRVRHRRHEKSLMIKALKESAAGLTDSKALLAARRQAVEDLYWAVLTSQEFLFNH